MLAQERRGCRRRPTGRGGGYRGTGACLRGAPRRRWSVPRRGRTVRCSVLPTGTRRPPAGLKQRSPYPYGAGPVCDDDPRCQLARVPAAADLDFAAREREPFVYMPHPVLTLGVAAMLERRVAHRRPDRFRHASNVAWRQHHSFVYRASNSTGNAAPRLALGPGRTIGGAAEMLALGKLLLASMLFREGSFGRGGVPADVGGWPSGVAANARAGALRLRKWGSGQRPGGTDRC
jgi:hypothetical protein